MKSSLISKIAFIILAGLSVYFYSETVKLNRTILKLEQICGDKCLGATLEFPVTGLAEIADTLQLDKVALSQCLSSAKFAERVNTDFNSGSKVQIGGTPAVFIYNKNTGVGAFAAGAYPYDILKTVVEKLRDSNTKEGDTIFEDSKINVSIVAEKFGDLAPLSDRDHTKGSNDSDVVMVEYSDLECPFCAKFHPTATQLTNDMNLLWVFRHFPLRQAHPEAQKMAEAAECAADQKGPEMFWQIIDEFYKLI